MKEEIRKIIEANLPAQTAGVLQDYVEQAEKDKESLVTMQKTINHQSKKLNALEEKRDEYSRTTNLIKKARELAVENEAAGAELTKREHAMANTIMHTQMAGMQAHMATMERLVDKVFGHPGVTITSEKQIPASGGVQNQYGGYDGVTYAQPATETETKTESKS